jgi:hypothetical protein
MFLAFMKRQNNLEVRRPGGRRTGCAPFFDRAMDGESKNPGAARPATLALIGERALSFGYFSLGPCKEK